MGWTKWLTGALIVVGVLLALNLMQSRYGELNLLSEAMAQNRTAAGGDYVMAAARTTSSTQLLYVVDTRLKKMVVYGSKRGSKGRMQIIDIKNLNSEFPKGCSGQVVLLPFAVDDRAEGMAVLDTVNKKMMIYVSYNYGRLSTISAMDLAKDLGS